MIGSTRRNINELRRGKKLFKFPLIILWIIFQMSKKKASQRLEGEEQSGSESNDSQMQRKMEQFDSDRSWSELDEMQRQLAEGIHEVSSPEEMPRKPKKKDRKKEREEEIAEYQEALKIAQQKNTKFINPFGPYNLNVDINQYRQLILGVVEGNSQPQKVARIMGFKSLRILHNERLYKEFELVKKFLEDLAVPDWVKQSHQFLLGSEGNVLFKPAENTSLENMTLEG